MAEPAQNAPEAPEPLAVVEPEPLEGEDKGTNTVGVLVSEKPWVVPGSIKIAFFWIAIASLMGLGTYEFTKRREFNKLIVDSVVDPENAGGKPAPVVKLPAGDGGAQVDLAGYKGKWVIVNFWATWCPPCRDEMPSMEMLNRRFARDGKPIVLVAVSVDEDWKEVNRFFADTKPTFTVLWDREKSSSLAFGTRRFPETYLVDPDGKVVAKFTGPRDWYNQATVKYFDDVIAKKRPPA